jgi:hypothetical protein
MARRLQLAPPEPTKESAMKILSAILSTALLAGTGAVAVASPYDRGGNDDGTVQTYDHRGNSDDGDGNVTIQQQPWSGRLRERNHRVGGAWIQLATTRVSGRQTTIAVDGIAKSDLKLQLDRGRLDVKKIVVQYTDGSREYFPASIQLTSGESQTVVLSAPAKPIASITLRYAMQSHAQLSLSLR